MPRGKPRKRPVASTSAERPPAQSERRNPATAIPVLALEDNINAVSNSGSVTNEAATDAGCTPSGDSPSVTGPGSSIQGNTTVSVFSDPCTPGGLGTNTNTRFFPNHHFQAEFNRLIEGSIAPNTRLAYKTGLVEFDRFRVSSGLPLVWPPSDQHIIQFIVSCSSRGFSSASVRTYLSGISFKCKLQCTRDPTQNFVVKKLLADKYHGCSTSHYTCFVGNVNKCTSSCLQFLV